MVHKPPHHLSTNPTFFSVEQRQVSGSLSSCLNVSLWSCFRRCITLVGLAPECCSLFPSKARNTLVLRDLATHSMTWQWFWSLAGTAVCPSLWCFFFFTKRKLRLFPAATCTFFWLVFEPPRGYTFAHPHSFFFIFFVLKGWAQTPASCGSSSAQRQVLGCSRPSASKCRSDTSSVHTRAHTVIVFVHAVCPAIFSLFLWTVVCVCVCPRSKPHVLDGKRW